MAGKIEELKLHNARVESTPLKFEKAEDLLPDVAQIVSRAFDQATPELAKLVAEGNITKDDPRAMLVMVPAISGILQQLGGGKLKSLAPKILATTQVYLTNEKGEVEKYDLVSAEDRSKCFDERPDIYFQTMWFAGKVTFARFFPATGRSRSPQQPTNDASS